MASVTIHRGSHQIGGCVTEFRTEKHRIIIDFGQNLPGTYKEDRISDEELLRRVFAEPADGVLFTHYHGDHIGMYKAIPEGNQMYIGATAKEILEILTARVDGIPDMAVPGLPIIRSMRTYPVGQTMRDFGDILVTPLVVDHSALDAYMFLIEIGGKRVLYTGDFREHGIAGRSFEAMIGQYVGKVDILITEGTMLSRRKEEQENPIRTEDDLTRAASRLFRRNKRNVVLVSSTNLDSVMGFFHAVPWGMDFVCDEYQAELILSAIRHMGRFHAKYRRPMIHGKERRIYLVGHPKKLGCVEGCYPADFSILNRKGYVLLARENHNPNLDQNRFEKILDKLNDPLIVYSKWAGYLDTAHGGYTDSYADPAVNRFIGNRRFTKLHTSGHAYASTLEKLIRLTEPEIIIPMHTECAEEFAGLSAFSAYQRKVRVLQDGEKYAL